MTQNNSNNLINPDRTWRTIVCISPTHELVKFDSNQVGDIRCPLCNSLMVVLVTPQNIVRFE